MKLTIALIVPFLLAAIVALMFIVTFSLTHGKIEDALFNSIVVGGGAAGYLLPSFIAGVRNAPHYPIILGINILGGWTVIGWIAALIWAVIDKKDQPVVVQQFIYREKHPQGYQHSNPVPPKLPSNII
jgi:hypothetical protein